MKHKKKVLGGLIIASGLYIVPTLIGGDPAPKDKYPSTVRIFMDGASCTATLIGSRVLLTAAHCVGEGGHVEFQYKGSNVVSSACNHHSGYAGNQTMDFALCELPRDLSGIFESINTDHGLVSKGDQLRLTGYGCTKTDGSGGNDGILREGFASVTGVPSNSNFDIVTTAGPGALCYGDSGGPAFYETPTGRVVVGVNSRGDIEKTSYLSAVHMADQSYMKKWADAKGLKICGIHSGGSCVPKPQKIKPPEPPDEPGFFDGFSLEKILEILQKIFDLLADFFNDKSSP